MQNASDSVYNSRGCDDGIPAEFRYLCDLDALWGVIVLGIAGLGLLLTLVYAVIFSANLKLYIRHQKNRYSNVLYFALLGIFLLFAFSITFVIQPTTIICTLRRVGIGLAWTITLAPLFVAVTRMWKMSYLDEIRCCWLVFAVICFICVEVIILVQWNILKHPAPTTDKDFQCEERSYDLPLSLIFNGVLLLLFFASSVISCCKKNSRVTASQNTTSLSVSFLITSILIIIISAGWAVMVSYGNKRLNKEKEWADPSTAMYMVISGIVILITIFSPILHTMRKIRKQDDDMLEFEVNNQSMTRLSYGSDKLQSLPTADHRTCSYGTTEDFERCRNFPQSGEENAMAMSDLSFIKPIPAKRSVNSNYVDRLRPMTSGRYNSALQLDEEDIWRNRALD